MYIAFANANTEFTDFQAICLCWRYIKDSTNTNNVDYCVSYKISSDFTGFYMVNYDPILFQGFFLPAFFDL